MPLARHRSPFAPQWRTERRSSSKPNRIQAITPDEEIAEHEEATYDDDEEGSQKEEADVHQTEDAIEAPTQETVEHTKEEIEVGNEEQSSDTTAIETKTTEDVKEPEVSPPAAVSTPVPVCKKAKGYTLTGYYPRHTPGKGSGYDFNMEGYGNGTLGYARGTAGYPGVYPFAFLHTGTEQLKEGVEELISKSIWVWGLPPYTKAAELKSHFMQYGRIARVKMFTTKKANPNASCSGYVTFKQIQDTEEAIKNSHITVWKGIQLVVGKGPSLPSINEVSSSTSSGANDEKKSRKNNQEKRPVADHYEEIDDGPHAPKHYKDSTSHFESTINKS